MDTTLKRYGNKVRFKTHDPAEEPIKITWQAKKKHRRRKKRKKDYQSRDVYMMDMASNNHLRSIRQERLTG